jgi:hypothetical protein
LLCIQSEQYRALRFRMTVRTAIHYHPAPTYHLLHRCDMEMAAPALVPRFWLVGSDDFIENRKQICHGLLLLWDAYCEKHFGRIRFGYLC